MPNHAGSVLEVSMCGILSKLYRAPGCSKASVGRGAENGALDAVLIRASEAKVALLQFHVVRN